MNRRGTIGGFTLIEVLIAIVIGLFLTAGMIQMYVANKQSYRFNEALARIQENGRFALESISRDLRTAYFFGCSRGINANEVAPGNYCFNLAANVCGTSCVPPTTPGVEGEDGTRDNVFIRGAGRTSVNVNSTSPVNILNVRTDATQVLTTNDLALVANCVSADLFRVAALSTTTVTPNNDLSTGYDTDALVFRWQEVEYFVQPNSFGESALFRRANRCSGGTAQEMVEGIEDMQITYGEDTDNDSTANRYVDATTMNLNGDWDRVVSVRVNLLLTSTETGLTTDNPQSYDLDRDGTDDATCPTSRICQVMTTTVALRNRTP